MWRGLAEVASRILKKFQLVYIEGKLTTRKVFRQEGRQRYITEVIAEKVTLLGRKSDFENIDTNPHIITP